MKRKQHCRLKFGLLTENEIDINYKEKIDSKLFACNRQKKKILSGIFILREIFIY